MTFSPRAFLDIPLIYYKSSGTHANARPARHRPDTARRQFMERESIVATPAAARNDPAPAPGANARARVHMAGSLVLAGAALCWAGNYAVGRIVAADIPPATLNLLRWSVAVCFLLPFAAARLRACYAQVRDNFIWFLGMALCAVVIHPTLVYAALNHTSATNMALIIAGTPAMMLILSSIKHGERHSRFRFVAVGLSFLGIAVLVWNRVSLPNTGDLMGCVAMTFWAYYNVSLRDGPADVDGMALTTIISIIGALIMVPLALLEVTMQGGVEFKPATVMAVLYVGLFASGIAYLLWNRGVAEMGAHHAAQFMNLVPVFGVLIGILVLDESFTMRHGIAAMLILGGLLISEWHRREFP